MGPATPYSLPGSRPLVNLHGLGRAGRILLRQGEQDARARPYRLPLQGAGGSDSPFSAVMATPPSGGWGVRLLRCISRYCFLKQYLAWKPCLLLSSHANAIGIHVLFPQTIHDMEALFAASLSCKCRYIYLLFPEFTKVCVRFNVADRRALLDAAMNAPLFQAGWRSRRI